MFLFTEATTGFSAVCVKSASEICKDGVREIGEDGEDRGDEVSRDMTVERLDADCL